MLLIFFPSHFFSTSPITSVEHGPTVMAGVQRRSLVSLLRCGGAGGQGRHGGADARGFRTKDLLAQAAPPPCCGL